MDEEIRAIFEHCGSILHKTGKILEHPFLTIEQCESALEVLIGISARVRQAINIQKDIDANKIRKDQL